MDEELVNTILGAEKDTLQTELLLFCQHYNNCLGINGLMDVARGDVSRLLENLARGVRPDNSMLVASERAENKLESVRAQLNQLNIAVVRIVGEEIKPKVRDFVLLLASEARRRDQGQGDKKLLAVLGAKRSSVARVPMSSQQPQLAVRLDLLTAEESRYLTAFMKSDVADSMHKMALEELTTQVTVRVCKSLLMGVKMPEELITDPEICFAKHLKAWQATFEQLHVQHTRLEKIVHVQQEEIKKKNQILAGITAAEEVLRQLTDLKYKTEDLCGRLQEEIKDPGYFYAIMRLLHMCGPSAEAKKKLQERLGVESDEIAIKRRGLELQQQVTIQIGKLVEAVNDLLQAAKSVHEGADNLVHVAEGLGTVKEFLDRAEESVNQAKAELKKI